MSEFVEKVSEEVLDQDEETSQRGRPGTNPPEEPQPGLHPGAGQGPEQAGEDSEQEPEQGFGEPDSH